MAKQSKHIAPYPPELRAEAIRLAHTSGKPNAQIARELGMTGETLRLWLKQADVDDGKRNDGLTGDEQKELRRRRRERPQRAPGGSVKGGRGGGQRPLRTAGGPTAPRWA